MTAMAKHRVVWLLMRSAVLFALSVCLFLLAWLGGCTPQSRSEVQPARTELTHQDDQRHNNTGKVHQEYTVEIGPPGSGGIDAPFRLEDFAGKEGRQPK